MTLETETRPQETHQTPPNNTLRCLIKNIILVLSVFFFAAGAKLEADTLSIEISGSANWTATTYALSSLPSEAAENFKKIKRAVAVACDEVHYDHRTVRVIFPSGTFHVDSGTAPSIVINSPSPGIGSSLSIEGQYDSAFPAGDPLEPKTANPYDTYGAFQTTLVFHNPEEVSLLMKSCNWCTIKNLHLTRPDTIVFPEFPEFGPQPGIFTTEGVVVATGTQTIGRRIHSTIDVQIYQGFPNPAIFMTDPKGDGHERVLIPFREPDKLRPELDLTADVVRVISVSATWRTNIFRFVAQTGAPVSPRLIGRPVALKGRTGQNTIRIFNSNHCTLENLLITRFSGNPIRSSGDTNWLTVRRVRVDRPAEPFGVGTERRRPFLAGADGAIQLVCGEHGPQVKDCIITGMADDPIGIFSAYAITDSAKLSSGIKIINNTISDASHRGLLITQTDGLDSSGAPYTDESGIAVPYNIISGNTFIRTGYWALALRMGKVYARADSTIRDWTIEGNTFKQQCGNAVIALVREYSARSGRTKTFCEGTSVRYIQILNNIFCEAPAANPIVFIDTGIDTVISNNDIKSYSSEVWLDNSGATMPEPTDLVYFRPDNVTWYPDLGKALFYNGWLARGTHSQER